MALSAWLRTVSVLVLLLGGSVVFPGLVQRDASAAGSEEAAAPAEDPDGLPEFTPENTVSGRASAIDGDTIRVGRRIVHLFGIEAPAMDAVCTLPSGGTIYCGRSARAALDTMVRGTMVFCLPWPDQDGDEVTAFCKVSSPRGEHINRKLVERGAVFALPRRFRERSWPSLIAAAERVQLMQLGVYTYEVNPPWSGTQRVGDPGRAAPGAPGAPPAPRALPPDPMAGG